MSDFPETGAHLSQTWAEDDRREPPRIADEVTTLTSFLDWHRRTLELKCAELPARQLADKAVPPSALSLHGLVRHLAGVERWWFRIQFRGEDLPMLYYSDDDPDQDFESLHGDFAEALASWRAECDASRKVVAEAASLDETGTRRSTGEPISLRWVLVNLIAEYARHNGHADLLRERLDGATGH
ncbi:DinB family protein [Saccharopolyspora erythraea]|uniref:DinB family protein n=1 Tax=Saccharopolyspora erythraea TaxID=1836 RepID=UPI001BAACC20|nr:DinB family protein [Saccharopolyspora erythraea]QUH00463.1 DinB family protein [Saccharopolyspora erythraea]